MVRRRRSKTRRQQLRGPLRLGLVVALLVGVNIYVFFFKGGTSIQDVKKAVQQARIEKNGNGLAAPAAKPAAGDAPIGGPAAGRVVEAQVKTGDSLGGILRREGLTPPEGDELIRALRPVLDFKTIREGQSYRLRFDDQGSLVAFELRVSPVMLYRVERGADGKLVAQKSQAKTEIRQVEVSGEIASSLYDAVKSRGESTELVAELVDLFAYDINFFIETRVGDHFKLVVEKEYLGDEFYRYGRILAAEYAGNVGTYRAFYWTAPGGQQGAYFDDKGQAVAKSLLKTPLKFSRISSGFNPRRMHPVLHRVKGHMGTDYAAPTGTPIWASASGRVSYAGPKGGAGNLVVLDHGGGVQTLYMHLSRFAKGLRSGQRVAQKQVIGYVGATGLATGPHLHFGVKKNGSYIDPKRLTPRREAPVPKGQLATFQSEIAPRVAVLERLGSTMTATAAPAATETASQLKRQ